MAKERRSRFANPVAVLVDDDSAERYGLWLESLLVSLVDEGLSPILLTAADVRLGRAIPERAMARLSYPRTRIGLLQHLWSREMVDQLRDEPIRLVLAASGQISGYGNWLADQWNVPLAVMVMAEQGIAPVASIGSRLAAVFAATRPLAEAMSARLGARARIVHQIGLGVHLGQRVAAFSDEDRARAILAAGPLENGFGFDQLVAAFAHLAERQYTAEFFIVGAGRAERSLRQLAARKNLTQRLTFVPHIRGLRSIYDGIDIYVQPYVSRRLDLHLFQAMAAGVAVLARNGGVIDFVHDGINGIELTNADEAELTLVLQRLLDEPELARRLGGSARHWIQTNHLAGVTVQKVVDVVKDVALAQQTIKLPAKG